jgi:molybdopterin molybdotransferase
VVEFRGVVRPEEDGQVIAALEYEAYEPMAHKVMTGILDRLLERHGVIEACVAHRVGRVPAGEAAIVLRVTARHRQEAFACATEFMDLLKRDVPIWKRRAWPAEPGSSPGIQVQTAVTPASLQTDAGSLPQPASGVEEVLRMVLETTNPLPPERAPLALSLHRVLAEDVLAPEDQPPFDRSAVDGFAVRLDDASSVFEVVDFIRAGEWKPRSLGPGQAVQIATGGALPCADLRVIMKEDARLEDNRVHLVRHEDARNIRFRGEDARQGQVLLRAGTRLNHGSLALLASLGKTEPLVSPRPRVVHLVTGDEIVPPDQAPGPGCIRDSNSTLVRAFLASWGIEPCQARAREDRASGLPALREALGAGADLLLVSGGASVGEHDFTRGLLKESGFRIHLSKTRLRPGKPLIFASRPGCVAFGLPGNPLAHFVTLNLFVRAALDRLCGLPASNPFALGILGAPLEAGGHARETLWPARLELRDGLVLLWPLRWSSSGDLTSLAQASALIRVPAGSETLPQGARVPFAQTVSPS